MPDITLNDLTLWRWSFFVRWHSPNRPDDLDKYDAEFGNALDKAVKWAGGWGNSLIPRLESPALARQTSVRFASLDWAESGGLLRALEASSLLDGYYIQAGCVREGRADEKTVSRLGETAWRCDRTAESFLGEAVTVVGELPPGEAPRAAEMQAASLFESLLGEPVRHLQTVELPWGVFAVPAGVGQEIAVLLVQSKDEARREAAQLLNHLMPNFLVSTLKGRRIIREYESFHLPGLRELEFGLEAHLTSLEKSSRRLESLEKASDRITRQQLALADQQHVCEEKLETLRVNIGNIERPLKAMYQRSPEYGRIEALLADPLRWRAEQIATDLRFTAKTYALAEQVLQGVNTLAQVRSARWERRVTLMLGLFVAFGVAQAFPERPAPDNYQTLWWRLALVVITTAFIYGVVWWLSRRE